MFAIETDLTFVGVSGVLAEIRAMDPLSFRMGTGLNILGRSETANDLELDDCPWPMVPPDGGVPDIGVELGMVVGEPTMTGVGFIMGPMPGIAAAIDSRDRPSSVSMEIEASLGFLRAFAHRRSRP